MIAVLDYGRGNLRSVVKAFEYLGYEACLTQDANTARSASHLILPGVGAFRDAKEHLIQHGMDEIVLRAVEDGKPLLGICLGMQLLFDSSTEDGYTEGLHLLRGDFVRFDISEKVPHIGWNEVVPASDHPLFRGIEDKHFYFVHSYYLPKTSPDACAWTEYGIRFASCAGKNNLFGVQFHPEKSGESGLKLLRNFGELR